MPAGFQQAPVLKLSPDYKVFISGMSSLPTTQGTAGDPSRPPLDQGLSNKRDLASDVPAVNISMSIANSPGTANFQIYVPRHRTDATAYVRDGELMIKPMMEVHMYLRGRFNDTDNAPMYYLAFWGVISTVQEQYSSGTHSINVSCTDILRWWEITKVVTAPSAVQGAIIDGLEVTGQTSIYTGMDAHTIIYDLGKVSMQNFFLPNPINVGDVSEQQANVDLFNREQPFVAEYWSKRFRAIRSSMRLYGFHGFELCYNRTVGPNQSDSTILEDAPWWKFGWFRESPCPAGTKCWKQTDSDILSSNYTITKVRTCDNQIQAMYPYKTVEGRASGQQEGQQRSKLEIAQEVAKNAHWEFFLDMDGTVVFKPPFYNLDVRANEPSVVRDIDIISYTRTETEQAALTSVYVSGRMTNTINTSTYYGGWWIDWPLALEYGLRHESREEWRLTSPKAMKQFAQAELVKHNADLQTLNLVIPGRPELRLGYPIYIEPMDSFYYIHGIDHNIQTGGTFTTTLSLKGKRTRVRGEDGTPRKLLAAVQNAIPGQDGKVFGNDTACQNVVGLFGSAFQTLANSAAARADAGSQTETQSSKGKRISPMKLGTQTPSEQSESGRTQSQSDAYLDRDPCNETYAIKRLNKITQSNAKHMDNRLSKDGNAPGDWKLIENHPVIPKSAASDNKTPVDDSEVPDEIQLTDEQGYKLFGPFLYGRFVALSAQGLISTKYAEGTENQAAEMATAVQASPSDPSMALRYLINPNIGAIRLSVGSSVGVPGAGVGGEAFAATRLASEEASDPKRFPPLHIGVDKVNRCEVGSVSSKAGADTPEARENLANMMACKGASQGDQLSPEIIEEIEKDAK